MTEGQLEAPNPARLLWHQRVLGFPEVAPSLQPQLLTEVRNLRISVRGGVFCAVLFSRYSDHLRDIGTHV